MSQLNQWHFFPRSLRQLVMMAFFLVLIPLLVLAWQAWQSLNALSAQAEQTNRSTLADVRRSEIMTNIALEMERSYRQYCVLDDSRLSSTYQSQHERYAQMLEAHASAIVDLSLLDKLNGSLALLSTLQCRNNAPDSEALKALERFASSNADMLQATRAVLFSRGQQLQQNIAERGQFFGWQALVLFLLSLSLVIIFTRMIIGPVKSIERMIKHLGEGRLLEQRENVKGPRELRSVGQRIVWLSERLRWLESQRHEFLRHISHELKTPLASMREGTELLADQVVGPLTADQKEVVAILDNSSRHLQRLIEQLLDYNRRVTDGTVELEKVELAPLIATVVAAHRLPARAKKMRTEIELTTVPCLAEPVLLMSVLDNLYSNAVHYGRGSGTIYIRSTQSGNVLQIDVANTGQAIPESESEMIFEPFYQGSLQRKGSVKGSGLGLSIAKDCIHRMKGQLYLIDDEKADVCFRIELPVFSGNDITL